MKRPGVNRHFAPVGYMAAFWWLGGGRAPAFAEPATRPSWGKAEGGFRRIRPGGTNAVYGCCGRVYVPKLSSESDDERKRVETFEVGVAYLAPNAGFRGWALACGMATPCAGATTFRPDQNGLHR